MEELSTRMEETTAKVAALIACMDSFSPSLPPADSHCSSPSQMIFTTSIEDFGPPKRLQSTSTFTPPNPGLHGLASSMSPELLDEFYRLLREVPPVSTGSSYPPYAPYSEQDPAQLNIPNNYQSISCIPAYRGTSFEELRVQDYAQGWNIGFGQSAPVTTGSSYPPYAPYFEYYQSISCTPAYCGTSFEELRVQDYAQGRKIADAFVRTAAFGGVQDPHAEPRISYSSDNSNNEAWIRHRLIDSKEPILFVGESENRSLPVALAIMRESWDGIWASSLHKEETQKLPALLAVAQRQSQMNTGFSDRRKKSSPWKSVQEMRNKLSELTNALDSKSHEEIEARLSLVVDATRLKTSIQRMRNIWFQCPWISPTTTAKLLESFISSAATIQQSGDAIFLGLTTHTKYRDAYDLENLKKVARSLGYEIFVDEWFIRHAIDAGYKHKSVKDIDIHMYLIDHHQTFVLVKREHSEHTSMKEQISSQRKELEAQLDELELHLRDLRTRLSLAGMT
ncbi:hypothetical protein MVEN_00696900 [Mycena venus]|uniref:Uncharacterized protein n=1 Tax=Mycena venus TaxID=2733690 RepID=A0A8H6YH91_9AGAR|nr:hypothetical protein MVEN_00696900 [Mycena venus]